MNIELVLLKRNGEPKPFPVRAEVTTVGRRSDCDFIIPILEVSRRHCQFECDDNQLKIRDLGSSNGTFVNGEKVEDAVLKAGDTVRIGPVEFEVQIDGKPASIEAKEAKPSLSGQKVGKSEDSGEVAPAPKAKELSDSDFFAKLDIDEDAAKSAPTGANIDAEIGIGSSAGASAISGKSSSGSSLNLDLDGIDPLPEPNGH